MKTTSLCGRPSCGGCPSVYKDEKTGITYIVDGNQKIEFTKEQLQELSNYLAKELCACKCKSCQR